MLHIFPSTRDKSQNINFTCCDDLNQDIINGIGFVYIKKYEGDLVQYSVTSRINNWTIISGKQ